MRQPQAAKVSSPTAVRVNRITSSDRNRPSVAVVWIQRRIEAAPAMRRVFGDIGRGAAIFAAERQALQQAQRRSGCIGAAMPIWS